MGKTYDEWVKTANPNDKKETPKEYRDMVIRRAVAAENLTTSEDWNYFLSVVQGSLETARSTLDANIEALLQGELTNYEEIMRIKSNIKHTEGVILAFDWVISAPAAMIKEGNELRGLDFNSTP